MTPREAAQEIGCSSAHVRAAIRAGLLRARRMPLPQGGGYYYEIPPAEVSRFQYYRTDPRGRKRGYKVETNVH